VSHCKYCVGQGVFSTSKPCGRPRGARCTLPRERNDIGNETNPIECSFVKRLDAGRCPGEEGRPGDSDTLSPGAETSVTINGKNLWIYYHAPSVRGRHIFGGAGALQPYGKAWRLGADYATVLHTDADLDLNGLAIPKGDYALYVDLDNGQWKLIVNKTPMDGARHIWGVGVSPDGIQEGRTTNDPATELGRASLTMGKPSSPVETLKITLSGAGGAKGKLLVEWEYVTASAPFTVR